MSKSGPKEKAFVLAVSKLGIDLGVKPADALFLFGRIAREIVEYGVKSGKGTFEELTKEALDSFCTGLGGAAADVVVTKVDREGMH